MNNLFDLVYQIYKAIASYALNSRGILQSHQAYTGKAPTVKPLEALFQVLYQSHKNSKSHGEGY
jgi:hypothetical protein